jgi:D-alanyl-D-alanine carboxypeptidase (penicillin-binding protein 5/6)
VILGAPARLDGDRIRDDDGRRLLSWAFENFKTIYPVIGNIESARLWKGREKTVVLKMAHNDPLLAESAAFTAPRDRAGSLWMTAEIKNPLIAPLPSNFPAGWLVISDEQGELHRIGLLTAKNYEKGNMFRRIWDSIRLFVAQKLFHKPW